MYFSSSLNFSTGAIVFTTFFSLIASRPLDADILPREASPNGDLACRQVQVTSVVYVTVHATTDITTTVTSTAGSANAGDDGGSFVGESGNGQPVVAGQPVTVSASTSTRASTSTSTSTSAAQTVKSTTQSSAAAAATSQSSSGSTSGSSSGSGPACTMGDPVGDLGFHITNAGSKDATYYFYASVNAASTSETVHYKCAEIGAGKTIFASIVPGLNGRINRGLPYSETPDHPSRGPASWFEFNHNITANVLWGDVSLIQGYDGAISVKGANGDYGFSSALPMATVSASYSAALTTKTGYPSNIPAPTVIGPTTATASVVADQQAYAFYSNGYPNGPCGSLQNSTYCSNNRDFNPSYETSNNIFSVTFYEGII